MARTPTAQTIVAADHLPLRPSGDFALEQVCERIVDAGLAGARWAIFPEGCLPGYPTWVWALPSGVDPLLDTLRTEVLDNAVRIPSDTTEQSTVAYNAVFDRFVKARLQVARRKRAQHLGIDRHERRLVEGANEILTERMVNSGFAADRAVYLSQERSGNLNQAYPPQISRRDKSRKISDDASTQCHNDVGALDPTLD